MKFSKKEGYYKYYNKEGKWCRIKFDDNLKCKENFRCFIWFWRPKDSTWLVHSPNKKFKDVFHVINFICKNLETNGVIFKVTIQGA